MKNNINLFQIVGTIVFILWTMGKVPMGIWTWIIPYVIGSISVIVTGIANKN